jgi:2-polyprenyl-3-methyl-5-hydroxy-6-metoxy-1,4-benzoquinol methylase
MESLSLVSVSEFNSLQNPKGLKFEYVNCYQCGADDFKTLLIGQDDLTGKAGNFRYVTCEKCNFVYLNPRVHSNDIKKFYDDDYIAHDRRSKGWLRDWGMKRGIGQHDKMKDKIISRHTKVSPETEILDVGCAIGTFLLHMHHKYRAKVSGVDFKDLSNYPEAKPINSYLGFFYDQNFGNKKFDVITMWHFLEHCYQPKNSLKMASSLLKQDGKLVIEVPRLDSLSYKLQGKRWPGVQAPQHLTIFDKVQFLKMVEASDLEVVEYLPWGAFPPLFYLYFGFIFKHTNGKGIKLEDHFWPYALFTIFFWPLDFFQSWFNVSMQTVVLRKK